MVDSNSSSRNVENAINILRNLLGSPELPSCMSSAIATASPVNTASVDAKVRSLFRAQNGASGRIGAMPLQPQWKIHNFRQDALAAGFQRVKKGKMTE